MGGAHLPTCSSTLPHPSPKVRILTTAQRQSKASFTRSFTRQTDGCIRATKLFLLYLLRQDQLFKRYSDISKSSTHGKNFRQTERMLSTDELLAKSTTYLGSQGAAKLRDKHVKPCQVLALLSISSNVHQKGSRGAIRKPVYSFIQPASPAENPKRAPHRQDNESRMTSKENSSPW